MKIHRDAWRYWKIHRKTYIYREREIHEDTMTIYSSMLFCHIFCHKEGYNCVCECECGGVFVPVCVCVRNKQHYGCSD